MKNVVTFLSYLFFLSIFALFSTNDIAILSFYFANIVCSTDCDYLFYLFFAFTAYAI